LNNYKNKHDITNVQVLWRLHILSKW
jgi:hypothetical protein